MSGLALFFHKTLESSDNDNNDSSMLDENSTTTPRRSQSSSITYDTSLVDDPAVASSSSLHDTTIPHSNEEEEEEDTVPWKTYAEWKQWQKNVVQDFCYHRIFVQDDDDDDDDEEQQPLQDTNSNRKSSNDDKENAAGDKVDQTAAAALDGRRSEESGLADEEDYSDDEQASAMFETQQPEVYAATVPPPPDDDDTRGGTGENSSSRINKKFLPAIIPCISETLGSVHYVADLDLQAAMVHLSRLSLNRTWPLRSTRRGAVKFQPWNFQRHRRPLLGRFLSLLRQEHQQQQLREQDCSARKSLQQQEILALVSASSLWHPGEDDGPLSIVYHDVLTMEVHELLEDDYGSDAVSGGGMHGVAAAAPSLRRRAEAPFLTTTTTIATKRRPKGNEPVTMVVSRRRLKIFLYDSYAKDMQTIMAIISASPQGASKVVVQLQNVPSWCIFPYNSHHHCGSTLPRSSDWYDSHGDLAPYCICIGDDCLVKYPKETAPLCLTSLPPNDRSESTEKDATLSSMRFDHLNLCMHVGLVVTRRRGTSHNQQPSADETSDPKHQRAASMSNSHHNDDEDGAAWLVLREWNVTAKGLREVKPNKGGHDPGNSSDDDDAVEHDDVNQPTSGRSVFGEWYSDYQEREQQQQSTSTMGGGDNSTVLPTGTTRTINDDTVAIAETAVVNTNALPQETQARERQTAATSSPSENDLPQQRSDKNSQEQALSVERSRILLQSEQNAQVTAAATTAIVNQQSTMSTTGPSNAGAGPLQPTAAAEEEARCNRAGDNGSVNQGRNSNLSGQVPNFNGQLQPDGMPSPRKRQRNMTQYCPLQDLRRVLDEKKAESSTIVQADVYGVVLGFGSPTRTKRGEWMMAVALVDENLVLPGETGEIRTVNLNIFSKRIDEMPQINFAGDVLRAHRIKVQEWNEEIQLMGLRASSYVVFRADSNHRTQTDNLTVLPTAKNEFAWTEEDKDRFIKLWQWGQRRLFSHPTMKESQSFKLSQMLWHADNKVEKYQDSIARGDVTLLVCAILEMAPEKKTSATPRGFLRVWDGTGPPTSDPFPDDCILNGYNASRDGDPPSCVVEKLAGMMQELRRIRQNPNLQEPKALTGRVANVAIWEEPFWELVQKAVKVGSFIRLRNVHDTRIPNGIRRYLMVFGKSYLTPLPNMTYEVVRMLEAHNDRLLNNDPLNPSSGVLPLGRAQGDSIRRSNARVSLASLVTQPTSTLFSGRVCIVGLIPSLNELASGERGGLNQICGPGRNFAVQLSDAYGRPPLDVILSGDSMAAARILGMSPGEASKEQNHQQVKSHLARITSNMNDSTASCWWNAKVRSVALEGAKYFVLESIDSL